MKNYAVIIERLLMGILISVFLLPAFLSLVVVTPLSHPWLRNATIGEAPQLTPWSWEAARNHLWQAGWERECKRLLPGREAIVRWTNQLHFDLFHQPSTYVGGIYVAPNDTLFEKHYLIDYFIARGEVNPDFKQVLLAVSQTCRLRGIGFVVVVTPSKAHACDTQVPPEWRGRSDQGQRYYEDFMKFLKQNNIPMVDGPSIASFTTLAHPDFPPVFPKGGTHWGQLAAFETAKATLNVFRDQGFPFAELTALPPTIDENPEGEERDLANLLTLVQPLHYPVVHVRPLPAILRDKQRLNLAIFGASFCGALTHQLVQSGQFCEVNLWGPKLQRRLSYVNEDPVTYETAPFDAQRDALNADCLLLEINEAALGNPAVLPLPELCQQMLVKIQGGIEAGRYGYDSYGTIPANGEFTFSGREGQAGVPFMRGFSVFEPGGIWTDGGVAEMRLLLPFLGQDANFRFSVMPNMPPGQPMQQVRVWADLTPVADWVFTAGGPTERDLTVSAKDISSDGRVHLRFQILLPNAPGTLDRRKLGVFFTNLRVAPTPTPPPTFAPFHPGETLFLRNRLPHIDLRALQGFSPAEPDFIWSDHTSARVFLHPQGVKPAGIQVDCNLAAYLHPILIPSQRVRVFANEHLVAMWIFKDGFPRVERFGIPAAWLDPQGNVTLRFECLRTSAPTETGAGPDPRALGVQIRSLTWR